MPTGGHGEGLVKIDKFLAYYTFRVNVDFNADRCFNIGGHVGVFAGTVALAAVLTPFIFPPLFLKDPPSFSSLSQPSRKTAQHVAKDFLSPAHIRASALL